MSSSSSFVADTETPLLDREFARRLQAARARRTAARGQWRRTEAARIAAAPPQRSLSDAPTSSPTTLASEARAPKEGYTPAERAPPVADVLRAQLGVGAGGVYLTPSQAAHLRRLVELGLCTWLQAFFACVDEAPAGEADVWSRCVDQHAPERVPRDCLKTVGERYRLSATPSGERYLLSATPSGERVPAVATKAPRVRRRVKKAAAATTTTTTSRSGDGGESVPSVWADDRNFEDFPLDSDYEPVGGDGDGGDGGDGVYLTREQAAHLGRLAGLAATATTAEEEEAATAPVASAQFAPLAARRADVVESEAPWRAPLDALRADIEAERRTAAERVAEETQRRERRERAEPAAREQREAERAQFEADVAERARAAQQERREVRARLRAARAERVAERAVRRGLEMADLDDEDADAAAAVAAAAAATAPTAAATAPSAAATGTAAVGARQRAERRAAAAAVASTAKAIDEATRANNAWHALDADLSGVLKWFERVRREARSRGLDTQTVDEVERAVANALTEFDVRRVANALAAEPVTASTYARVVRATVARLQKTLTDVYDVGYHPTYVEANNVVARLLFDLLLRNVVRTDLRGGAIGGADEMIGGDESPWADVARAVQPHYRSLEAAIGAFVQRVATEADGVRDAVEAHGDASAQRDAQAAVRAVHDMIERWRTVQPASVALHCDNLRAEGAEPLSAALCDASEADAALRDVVGA